jgi:Tfp pilus assembly protein PilV
MRPNAQAGFTFLELLFALGFFSIGLYGVVGLQTAVFNGNQRSSDVTIATHLAASLLEELHVRDLSGITTETFYFDPYGAQQSTVDFYKVTWTDLTPVAAPAYRDYQVTTTWLRRGETASATWPGHTVTLNTRVVERVGQ